MADDLAPSGGAQPAPVITSPSTLPVVADRLNVPASALGLETELPDNLRLPAAPDTSNLFGRGPSGPAAATGPAAPAPATGPAAPVVAPPAATGATINTTPPAAATGPAPEQKVKVGDKEYTTKELEKILADRAAQNNQPVPPPVPPPTAPAPTKEQIQAAEQTWMENFAKQEAISFPTTEAEVETILGGGKDAVELLGKKFTEIAGRAILLARKSVYADLNPQMEAFARRIEPLFDNHQAVERVSTEQAFLRMYPEYQGGHIETARGIAEALIEKYPQHVAKMTPQQFLETVNEHTDKVLQTEYRRWNPSATDTWREAAKRGATPAATPPTPTPAPPVPVTPAPPAQPDPWKQAPAPNSPASIPAVGQADWNKGVAKSLQD